MGSYSYGQDTTQTGFETGRIDLPDPQSIEDFYEYDPITELYIYNRKLDDFKISYPLILTPEEYQQLIREQEMKMYFQEKIATVDGRREGKEDEQKDLLPTFYVNSNFFETIFGGNTIDVIPQGSVEMDLGILFSKQDNPQFSPRNRSNFTFDFDQRISLSMLAKVGERLEVNANYDTQSTFDFQNQIKLEYTPTEDDIIRKIEVGNVSMPLNSSLIQGAQSLFGVKTELQFGKTTITGVFSEQKSQTTSVMAEGGSTVTNFEVFALDYDENRHFFLSHYFRDNYDRTLSQYPFLNTNIQITRVEVWITNRSNHTNDVRNIVALQDIGESNPEHIGLMAPPGGFITASPNAYPDNSNNLFNPFGINGGARTILNSNIRDITTVRQGFSGVNVRDGIDYVSLENARRLNQNEYSLHSQLGYISLNQRLENDEILAVSFQYTVNGKVYQVGEFSSDGVSGGGFIPGDPGGGIPGGDPQNEPPSTENLVVKMLKSSTTSVNQPIWDLMMKNIYPIGAYQLEPEDFKLNIVYADPSPLNYIEEARERPGHPYAEFPEDVKDKVLLNVFHLDRLNFNNDPQQGGDGFFDFIPGLTIDEENGRIIFTTVEPFGEHLFNKLNKTPTSGVPKAIYDIPETYNSNQEKYVFRSLYKTTKTRAEQEQSEKNKFQLVGSYKSSGAGGIPIGAFNVPRGSVTVTAGGRTLVEGVDYTVNYEMGMVEILDPGLMNSKTPISVTTENNTMFGQQTKRFTGLNVEHKFNNNFMMGATYLNLNERPLTHKSAYGGESVNNSVFGVNANYSSEVPFLTRLVNKLPNIDTDVESNVSIRGEFAYLLPGSPKTSDFEGKTTVYVDDFESSQTANSVSNPQSWYLSSTPVEVGLGGELESLAYNFQRAKLAWYTVDPIFYSSQRPGGISERDISSPFTRRILRREIFPDQDIEQGQTQALFTLDLAYYPTDRGPYNYNPAAASDGKLPNPDQSFGGISRAINTTDFERSNVEYIQFWIMDPFIYEENENNPGGTINFNLGNISEDILKDGRKQYENGLPLDGSTANTTSTIWGKVPSQQSLIYTFSSEGEERKNQDVGLDGMNNAEEAAKYPDFAHFEDPANDDYEYFLQAEGDILQRYLRYNGTEGNSPVEVSDTNRGSTTLPDVEDINRDNTMNTINSYYEYNIPFRSVNGQLDTDNNKYVTDVKEIQVTTPDNSTIPVRWVQFKIPISDPDKAIGGIGDFRSIRFMRMYLSGFSQNTVLRFGTLDLVRGDYRRFEKTLNDVTQEDPKNSNTLFEVSTVSIEENENRHPIPYRMPPGMERERLNHNNNIIRQNEQALSLKVCDLKQNDGRAVYKNFNIDMRQYKNLEMFIHAESLENERALSDGELMAFIRLGNDLTNNFYEIQIPLDPTAFGEANPEAIWPYNNRLNLPLKQLQEAKGRVLAYLRSNPNADPTEVIYYNQDELEGGISGGNPLKIGVKGNPNFGNVRTIMLGVKNPTNDELCGEVWFNELRLTELDNKGGWATVVSMDANMADFASINAMGSMSTVGFGSIDQGPNQRSLEDVQMYDVVTNFNLGQMLPPKWGIQLPFNYSRSEELITPKYDPQYGDVELKTRLNNTESSEEKSQIESQSVDYTRRQSVNFIGVRKERTGEAKPQVYDVENLTASFSYNQVDHHDFEVEDALEQTVHAGATYNYNFENSTYEPFKKNDSIFRGRYWQFMKDLNVNYLPTSLAVTSNITRQYNQQKFRDVDLLENNIGLPTLYQRNFLFDWQYTINYNITNSLRLNFTSSNNRIVNNYLDEEGIVNNEVGVWDGFFNIGIPNNHNQSLQVNYDLPFNKFPFLRFIRATYSYTGDFQWQKSSTQYENLTIQTSDGMTESYNLGNSIQNGNTHQINSSLDMRNFYRYIGLTKITPASKRAREQKNTNEARRSENDKMKNEELERKQEEQSPNQFAAASQTPGGMRADRQPGGTLALNTGEKSVNILIDLLTSLKRVQFNYQENNGIFLPGYLPSVGFMGTLKPTAGFVFGSQAEVRELAARNGWLTLYPEFNEQYTELHSHQMDIQANLEPIKGLTIDIVGSKTYSENYVENYLILDGLYQSLTPRTYGNYNISTNLIRTAFRSSDAINSQTFDDFRNNRLIIADRLAEEYYGEGNIPRTEDGFPVGYGKTSQDVLLPAFLAAYSGKNASKEKTGIFRDIPLPNWDLKYTGFMNLEWFKKNFKRFSVNHGYRAAYTVSQFETNLDYDINNPGATNQAGDFKPKTLLSNVNLTEQFSPLLRIDFEMMNSIKILAEMRKDRALSLSLANNLLTEIKGNEYIIGLGYRIKDMRIGTNIGGTQSVMVSDLNFKVDLSLRDNITIIRYLDMANNQTTAGQTIYGAQLTIDYALSKNLTALFYYDHTFSKYAISTAFPQTNIRSGFTLRYNFGN